jgi:hypothetical protein
LNKFAGRQRFTSARLRKVVPDDAVEDMTALADIFKRSSQPMLASCCSPTRSKNAGDKMAAVIVADVPQDGAKPTPGIRVAAEYRWAHPDAPWAEVAAAAGCHRNTLERWRRTEAWEIALRQAAPSTWRAWLLLPRVAC